MSVSLLPGTVGRAPSQRRGRTSIVRSSSSGTRPLAGGSPSHGSPLHGPGSASGGSGGSSTTLALATTAVSAEEGASLSLSNVGKRTWSKPRLPPRRSKTWAIADGAAAQPAVGDDNLAETRRAPNFSLVRPPRPEKKTAGEEEVGNASPEGDSVGRSLAFGALPPEEAAASRAAADRILSTYRDKMQYPTTGRDELSAHNKYHFSVRWFRLDGNQMGAVDAEQLRVSCVTYVDAIVRSFSDHCMLSCSTEIYQWSNVEYVRVAKFMDRHEIGKPKTAGRRSAAGGQVGALLAGKSDLRLRLIYTLAYWMQKLDDHGLLRYPDYRNFSSWSLRVLSSWLRGGGAGSAANGDDNFGDFFPEALGGGAGSSLGGADRPVLCGFNQHFMPALASNPVRVINTVYTLQRLGLCRADWAALELWNAFQEAWASAEPGRWKEYILGLTHFVLNESNFYQDAVDLATRIQDLAEALQWILDYFNQHISSLVGLGDPDLLAEVALCFLFCGRANPRDRESCAKCIAFIERCLQVDLNSLTVTGRLPPKYIFRGGPGSSGRGLKAEEHTNAVCFLALGFWARSAAGQRLVSHSGPIFANYEWKKYCDMYMTDDVEGESDASP